MISICIPTYAMADRGIEMLCELFASIQTQTYDDSDYEIIVSDDGGTLRDYVELFDTPESFWVPRYYDTDKAGAAANLNNAISHAKGDIIKPMFQDDKFMEPDSLQKIADALQDSEWIACTSHNEGLENYDHVPRIHSTLQALREGENTYGSPSAMAWRRNHLKFDENLKWLFDCEYYARMCENYGTPQFVDTKIFIRQWEGQATRTLCDGHTRILDQNEVIEKYRDRGGVART